MYDLEYRKKFVALAVMLVAMLLSALNQSVIVVALPNIISDIGGFDYFSWVFTAYIFAASIMATICGRMSDIHGRKPLILWGIGIFIVGSILSGLAANIIELIAFRVIQGAGGGVIIVMSFTAIGDLFSPRERGRWQGLFGATFGLASVIGPILGGFIVDHWHWKWVFWIFAPIGLVAFAMIFLLFPLPNTKQKHDSSIDYLGAVLLATTILTFLLFLNRVGQHFSLNSPEQYGLVAASAFLFALFIFVERRVRQPILPLHLFRNSVFTISNIIVFILSAGMFASLLFLPLFLQKVMGLSATVSGSMVMFMAISLAVASIFGGQIIHRRGKYKKLAFVGLALTTIGTFLLSTLNRESEYIFVLSYIVTVGFGLGMGLPVLNLTLQNAVDHDHLGIATATGQLSRQMGGIIGIALLGATMSQGMFTPITRNIPQNVNSNIEGISEDLSSNAGRSRVLLGPTEHTDLNTKLKSARNTMPQETMNPMPSSLNTGISLVFVYSSVAMLIAMLLLMFLKELPLRATQNKL
jgi:EmrB/QacA subfamily drug resistance transporter